MSGSGISWAVCKSAPRSIHRSVFYRPDGLPAAQPTASKHWRHWMPKSPVHNQYTMLYNTNCFLCTYLFLVLVIFITVLFLAPPAWWSWPSVSAWAHVNIPYCIVLCHKLVNPYCSHDICKHFFSNRVTDTWNSDTARAVHLYSCA